MWLRILDESMEFKEYLTKAGSRRTLKIVSFIVRRRKDPVDEIQFKTFQKDVAMPLTALQHVGPKGKILSLVDIATD